MPFCTQCGKELRRGDRFCRYCGAPAPDVNVPPDVKAPPDGQDPRAVGTPPAGGGGGKRPDHFLGNLHLLYKAMEAGAAEATLKTNGADITLCGKGERKFLCGKGKTVSLLPFGGEAHIMNMRGLKYAEKDLWLRYGSTRGISNVAADENFSFRVDLGYALVIINEEEV